MNRYFYPLAALWLTLTAVYAQAPSRVPHLGYVYPAGGKAGTTITVVVGGQNLHGQLTGLCSEDDIRVVDVKFVQPFRVFNTQRKELMEIMRGYKNGKLTILPAAASASTPAPAPAPSPLAAPLPKMTAVDVVDSFVPFKNRKPAMEVKSEPDAKTKTPKGELTREQIIDLLKALSPQELELLARDVLTPRNPLQINPALAQKALVKIMIGEKTRPGTYELRLQNGDGLSNPIPFMVGNLPEIKEPPFSADRKNPTATATIPAVLNGQIMPGEVASWKFKGSVGQPVTVMLYGRVLNPFLGDAVPGWFQPAIGVYDVRNRELAYSDGGSFSPDPKLRLKLPDDGEYELRVRDTLYRGREDFVYRIVLAMDAPQNEVLPLPAAVKSLPAVAGNEPNDTPANAQAAAVPSLISGTINPTGDVDVYSFQGKKGDEIVAEVLARRLNSPLDSLLRLIDKNGKVLAWNDDMKQPNIGVQTHSADSCLQYRLPEDGEYYLQVSDAQGKGGPGYVYWLRLDRPHPDFEAYICPSALNAAAGLNTVFTVNVSRKDGFNGEIEIQWPEAPSGFRLSGNIIPPGVDRIRMTLAVPDRIPPHLEPARLIGQAAIAERIVKRELNPADEQMQAFAYTHWVPALSLNVAVLRRMYLPVQLASPAETLRLVPGGETQLKLPTTKMKPGTKLEFELAEPPAGIALKSAVMNRDGQYVLTFSAGAEVKPGLRDNLIVRCTLESAETQKDGSVVKKGRSVLGVLPALPLEVVSGNPSAGGR